MKRKFLLVIFSSLMTISLFAQLDTIDIGKYVLPDLKWRSLSLQAGFFGANNTYKRYREENIQKTSYHDWFSTDISGNYSSHRNSKIYQGEVRVRLSPFFNVGKNSYNEEGKKDSSKRLGFYSSLVNNNRFYYRKKEFLEVDVAISIDGNRYNRTDKYNNDLRGSALAAEISTPVLWGFGRVEDVTDSWHALRILSDLQRLDLLEISPDEGQILSFAQLISERKHRRVFDFRNSKTEDITAIDNYLQNSDLVGNEGSIYYTSLYDMWLYGTNRTRRLSGTLFSFGITPIADFYYQHREGDTVDVVTYANYDAQIFATANFEYHKPINQKWQYDMDVRLGYGPVYFGKNGSKLRFIRYSGNTSGNVKLSYFLNTRTSFTSTFSGIYDIGTERFGANFNGKCHYYLSPRTRVELRLNAVWKDYDRDKYLFGDVFPPSSNEKLEWEYRFKITHSLF